MLSGTFVSEITNKKNIEIPSEMMKKLQLNDGDKVEVMVKRIRSRRLDIKISKHPLLKLLNLGEDEGAL